MFNPEIFIPMKASYGTKGERKKGKGVLTVISSKKNGHRIIIPVDLAEELQLNGTVQMGFQENRLVLGKRLPNTEGAFVLKTLSKRKLVLYSTSAVKRIVDVMELDFSQKVSHTFYDLEMDEWEGNPIALFEKEGEG